MLVEGLGLKAFIAIFTIVSVAGVTLGVGYGLGYFGPPSPSGNSASFVVGQIQPTSVNGTRRMLSSARNNDESSHTRSLLTSMTSNSDPSSNTKYSYAVVDSLIVYIATVQLSSANSTSVIWSSPTTDGVPVEIGKANTISINGSATIPNGVFLHGEATFKQKFYITAYCFTQTELVYTSPSGSKSIPRAGSKEISLPSDYGPQFYPFGYLSTAQSPNDVNDVFYEGAWFNYTITGNTTGLQVALLLDSAYIASCYDGTDVSFGSADSLAPFNWGNNYNYSITDFYNVSVPNFGLTYLPLFVYIAPASTPLPTGLTFISSDDISRVNSSTDFTFGGSTQVHTGLFDAITGEILNCRTRQFSSNYLDQFYYNCYSAGGSNFCDNGEQLYMGGPIHDRKLNFSVQPVGVHTTAWVTNQYDCCTPSSGSTCRLIDSGCMPDLKWGTPQNPCRNRECLTSPPQVLHWYQITRPT